MTLGEGVLLSDVVVIKRKYNGGSIWDFQWSTPAALTNLTARFAKPVQDYLGTPESLQDLRDRLAAADGESVPGEDLEAARQLVQELGLTSTDFWDRIVAILKPRLPRFFRFTNYSTLPGRIDFRELARSEDEAPASSSLQAARALLALAGTDLKQLGHDDYELRKGELEAVQIDLTQQVFEYWKQNPHLEVLIDVDLETVRNQNNTTAVARFLDIRLRDTRTGYSNNFSQRSSGFQWFFSFLAAFSEFEYQSDSSITVLLDEPALTLHGRAQADFLRFINERLAPNGQVLYTTHSPFMVEADKLERVRIIEDHGPPDGAVVVDQALTTDCDSLFPLQAALGYDIAQNLFVGPHNLVVEGTSDFIYISVISAVCKTSGRIGLDERWRLLPAGGATNIPTFVSLIGPHLDVTVVADSDTKGMQRVTNMVNHGLLDGKRLIMASVATTSDHADIEDLFSEGDYLELYNRTFGTSIKVSELPPGNRVVKRLEALRGETFVHGEVAETFLREHHRKKLTDATLNRFSALFEAINDTIESEVSR